MPEAELSLVFLRPLNRLGYRYVVSGGVASILYGEPRFTNDIDIVVRLRPGQAGLLCAQFPAESFYVDEQAAEQAASSRGQFNVIHPESGLKIDFIVASGRRSALPHGVATDRRLQDGDFVTFDCGAVYDGYHSDFTRTVVVGTRSFGKASVQEVIPLPSGKGELKLTVRQYYLPSGRTPQREDGALLLGKRGERGARGASPRFCTGRPVKAAAARRRIMPSCVSASGARQYSEMS